MPLLRHSTAATVRPRWPPRFCVYIENTHTHTHTHSIFPITLSNVNPFSNFYRRQISTEMFFEIVKNSPSHPKCVATLPRKMWIFKIATEVNLLALMSTVT